MKLATISYFCLVYSSQGNQHPIMDEQVGIRFGENLPLRGEGDYRTPKVLNSSRLIHVQDRKRKPVALSALEPWRSKVLRPTAKAASV
jgi:hypothetical protein